MTPPPDIDALIDAVYRYSRSSQYKGHNKHDGLNSPILNALLGWGKWPRMVAIQGVMRFPINLRPLLFTPKTYNPKGLALFTLGLLDRYETHGDSHFLEEAKQLLALLDTIAASGRWTGKAWGYHYPWRDPGFYAPSNTPNAVVTAFVCEAYLQAYRLTQDDHYLDVVGSAIGFFCTDLKRLKETDDQLCLGYMPLPMSMRVMDVSILVGAVISQYVQLSEDQTHSDTARRLVNYVVKQQTEEGAWFYTDPPTDSHIRHDNYHTGFILDALDRYMAATEDRRWQTHYDRGLVFYADKHFAANGAPRWMSDVEYPYDIHGAAQGILTFSRHRQDYPDLAAKIVDWAIRNMYDPSGRFYYQQTRYITKRFTLLRWCNAWMARALCSYQKV
ncbi:MAG: hypothetical protein QF609_09830 [Gammaproteobacteria bacterium]|nr:hypothetical protein [Gammaproteobacteria bacterium]